MLMTHTGPTDKHTFVPEHKFLSRLFTPLPLFSECHQPLPLSINDLTSHDLVDTLEVGIVVIVVDISTLPSTVWVEVQAVVPSELLTEVIDPTLLVVGCLVCTVVDGGLVDELDLVLQLCSLR